MWIVLVRMGMFTSCYGPFATYDEAQDWRRRNQMDSDDSEIYPVRSGHWMRETGRPERKGD